MKTFTFFFMLLLVFVIVDADNDGFFGERDGVVRIMARNNVTTTKTNVTTTKTNKDTTTKTNKDSVMTFFDGGELKNAACYGRDGLPEYDAKSTDFIGAMEMKGLEMCYQCLEIKNKDNNKKVTVKIIDVCDGCKPGQVDVTKTVFSKLADLDDGVVKISWKPVSCPSKGRFPKLEKKKNNS